MERETLNLLIGGGIGFLASFLITVATFIYQMQNPVEAAQ